MVTLNLACDMRIASTDTKMTIQWGCQNILGKDISDA
jgi:hypothetical protein